MQPVSPVIPDAELPEVVYAKDQPQYQPFPVYRAEDGTLLSRWRLSFRERLQVLFHGDVYLWVSTFNQPLQPVLMQTEKPEVQK